MSACLRRASQLSRDEHAFVDLAVEQLSHDGKVISVQLALFAEMVKNKRWVPATLDEVGGAGAIGLAFLEETFSSAHAPPEHRRHQRAARAVLRLLLPEQGTDIKGQMHSRAQLLAGSGYAERPQEFDELLQILDQELRLVTPAASLIGLRKLRRFQTRWTDPQDHSAWLLQNVLPIDPRFSCTFRPSLADPQATGDAARASGTAARGTRGDLQRAARTAISAHTQAMACYPDSDQSA